MKKKHLLILLILFSFGFVGHAVEHILFNRLGVRDGLLSNEITSLLKDRKGFMWIGTTSGLNRFDGYEFVDFKNEDETDPLAEERVSDLVESADGRIWITYYDSRIGLYDPMLNRFIPKDTIRARLGLSDDPARVFVDNDKRLHFTAFNNSFCRYDPDSDSVYPYPVRKDKGGVCGIGDTDSCLYVVHTSGLIAGFDKLTGKCVFEDTYLTAYSRSQPFYMFADSEGELWLFLNPGRSDGLFRLNPATRSWSHYTTNSMPAGLSSSMVRDVKEGPDGNLWIAMDHGGINILDKKSGRIRYLRNNPFDPMSLSQNSVVRLYRDDTGIMWAGTYKNGLNYYHESIFKFRTVRYPLADTYDLSNNDFNGVLEDRSGNLWIGTSGNGLLRYDRKSGTYTRYRSDDGSGNGLCGDVVISLAEDKSGNIWIGTYMNGLDCFDGQRFTHYHSIPDRKDGLSNNSIYSLYADNRNRLWIGTLEGGLNCLDLNTRKWNHYRVGDGESALSSDIIYSLSSDAKGHIIVGTSAGLNWVNPENGRVSRFKGAGGNSSQLAGRIINTVYNDSRQLVWIGTDHGLFIYDPLRDKEYCLDESDGLPDKRIMSIQEDQYHNMWIGTKNGLINMIPGREDGRAYKFTCVSYDESEGVQGRVFNVNSSCSISSGELAFGGTNGLTFVSPSRIRYNNYSPSPVITGLFVNNTPIRVGEAYSGNKILSRDISDTRQLTLGYKERNITLSISSCSNFLPLKHKYAFKMEGFNNEWITVGATNRRITYTNLNPGSYAFLVKGMNNDGVWSEAITRLDITIQPPFWATGWAIVFYILVGFLLVYGVVKYLFYVQRRKMEEERERASVRQQHEVDEMKLRFFTNVSHEFRTPLTLILTPLEKLIKTELNPESQQILGLIHRNADRLLKLVNQLLDFRKIDVQGDSLTLSTGDIVPFVREIAYSFKELSVQRHIHFSFSSVFTSLPMKFDTDKIFKIVSNLLSNAFKFTPEGGTILVTLTLTQEKEGQNRLFIEVTDNGVGIPADKQAAVFDRFYQVTSSDPRNPQAGTGIGLHLCREFVRMHHGVITLKSEPGKGSSFLVSLPVIPLDEQDVISSPHAVTESVGTNPDLGMEPDKERPVPAKSTLLVVDDNTDFLEFMRLSLGATYSVLTATNGEEAWQMIPEELPDMVISDVMMPITDGITLCRRIKEDIRTSHIPVVLLTAKSAKDSQLVGLEAGADDYICKPFNMEMLLLKIQHLVELKRKMQKAFMQSPAPGIALTEIPVSSIDEQLMRKAIAYIEEQITNPELSVERLSREMGMSRVNFYKKTLAMTGKSPVELIRTIRLKRAAQLLEKSQMRVNEVAFECGFNDIKLFRKYFKEEFGVVPSDYHHP